MTERDVLHQALELHAQVAVRPEPFGALAYHYGNRKLIFLRHPDVVRVVEAVAHHGTVADALTACGIDTSRWPSFIAALASLADSDLLVERSPALVEGATSAPEVERVGDRTASNGSPHAGLQGRVSFGESPGATTQRASA